jgi:hypothetical protein
MAGVGAIDESAEMAGIGKADRPKVRSRMEDEG